MGMPEFGVRRYVSRSAARPYGGTHHRHWPRLHAFERLGWYHPRRSSAGAAYGPHFAHGAAREAASAPSGGDAQQRAGRRRMDPRPPRLVASLAAA